jgi:hypothetical protein
VKRLRQRQEKNDENVREKPFERAHLHFLSLCVFFPLGRIAMAERFLFTSESVGEGHPGKFHTPIITQGTKRWWQKKRGREGRREEKKGGPFKYSVWI